MHPKYITRCRICGNTALTPVIDLGEQFLQGSFVKEGQQVPPSRKLPTKLVRCDVTQNDTACGLLQMANTYPPEVLYTNYWYRSGINATMRDHLCGIVDTLLTFIPARNTPLTVLDIGCNDGTLLRRYPAGTRLFGVDPSDIARNLEDSIVVVNAAFPSKQSTALIGSERFDIITSIAMYYDLEDPVDFAKKVREFLSQNGIWCLEMSYMPLMLMKNSFDTICHEHLEYYSLAVLEKIMALAGLRIFKIELNNINGGSLRCYACRDDNTGLGSAEDTDQLRHMRLAEFNMCLDLDAPYAAFQQRIEKLRLDALALVRGIMAKRQRIHVYGASTKGNVLLQWYGFDHTFVEAAADRNPDKVGARTLGTNIPIISEEESRACRPEYYLVLPWHFKAEFLEREKETILNGASFIFPLPEVSLVTKENFAETVAASKNTDELCTIDSFVAAVNLGH